MARPTFEQACARYVHRFTADHVPQWARKPIEPGKYHAPQFRSDAEWYANTRFPGEPGGPPARSRYCETTGQTWPMGQWLDKPYSKGQR